MLYVTPDLDVKAVAHELDITHETVCDALSEGKLRGYRIGRSWRTTREWLDAYKERRPTPAIEILLIEDNWVDARLVKDAVRSSFDGQLSIIHLDSAERALEALLGLDIRPDLIILDLVMPGMSGVDLLEQLCLARRDGRRKVQDQRPIIALTATASPAELERARRAGLSACYLKDINFEAFRDRVCGMLEKLLPVSRIA